MIKRNKKTDYEYGLRLIKIKNEKKPEDLGWADIADLLGLNIHKETLRKAASVSPYSGYSVLTNVTKYLRDTSTN